VSRPFFAFQYPSATTATPEGISTTARTPGRARARAGSNDRTFPPNTGERATTAVRMPGTRTSMPKMPRPFVFSRVSSRCVGFPSSRKSFGSLRGASAGGVRRAACSTSLPYESDRPSACLTVPFSARQVAGSTPQVSAAAAISMAFAVAPARRICSYDSSELVLPPVPWSPHWLWA
jgi:hypothetical protein